MPRDFGNRELIWTLTSNGKTEKAYGSLKPDYVVNATVMAANFGAGGQTGTVPDLVGNVGPVLKIEGELTRRVKVGEPVSLIAVATDDGKPRARPMQQFGANRTVPNSATGLRLVWLKYRGAGEVTFDPPQFSAWEDTRDGANSPWASGWRTPPIPAGNKWETPPSSRRRVSTFCDAWRTMAPSRQPRTSRSSSLRSFQADLPVMAVSRQSACH